MLLTVAAFVFVLGVLIFVHELGHFMAAKAVGIAVPRFSIGFGPATPLSFKRGETEYRVSWIPLGGYVKMASRAEQEAMATLEGGVLEEEYPADRLFEHKSLGARIVVISAGVIMNVLFAWAVYTAVSAIFGRVEDPTTKVARVDEESLPAAAQGLAGLPFGAQIVRVNGDTMASWDAIYEAIADVTSDRLRFDFAGGIDPVIVGIPGTDAEARIGLLGSLFPLWEARVGLVDPGTPAAIAGLQRGDLIVKIDGDTVMSWHDMTDKIEPSAGKALNFSIQREGRLEDFTIVPEEVPERDLTTDSPRLVGRIGIGPLREALHVRYGPLGAVAEGARLTADDAGKVWFTLKGMVLRKISPRELGGPIFIGQISGQFAAAGFLPLIYFMAFLSVNLAILNLLPIPVLDGGHLVFLLIEGVRGKPLSEATRIRLTQVGLFVLLGIMVLALTNDLFRVIGG